MADLLLVRGAWHPGSRVFERVTWHHPMISELQRLTQLL